MNQTGWTEDDAASRAFFDAQVQRFGLDARAADWSSRESQNLRFSVLASVDALEGRRILDVGCGTGELLAWLQGQGINVDYTGIDISPAMVATARQRFGSATIIEGGVLDLPHLLQGPVDHVFASGVFYRRRHDAQAFVTAAIAAMFDVCTRSVSFNSLSAWAPRREEGELYLDPAAALTMCRRHSSRLALRHDYHPADFTLHVYREARSA